MTTRKNPLHHKRELGPSALEAAALTARPTRHGGARGESGGWGRGEGGRGVDMKILRCFERGPKPVSMVQ